LAPERRKGEGRSERGGQRGGMGDGSWRSRGGESGKGFRGEVRGERERGGQRGERGKGRGEKGEGRGERGGQRGGQGGGGRGLG
jgi:hypothetical protein